MNFTEWRNAPESWDWPAGHGEPDTITMMERAWIASEQNATVRSKVQIDMLCEVIEDLMSSYGYIDFISEDERQQDQTIINAYHALSVIKDNSTPSASPSEPDAPTRQPTD